MAYAVIADRYIHSTESYNSRKQWGHNTGSPSLPLRALIIYLARLYCGMRWIFHLLEQYLDKEIFESKEPSLAR